MEINPAFEAIPRQRAIHRAGVHIDKTKRLGHELRVRALATRARAINSNNDWMLCFQFLVAALVRVRQIFSADRQNQLAAF